MHEFSIVQSILDTVEDYVRQSGASSVTRVVIRAGAISGIVPHLLQTAFETFREHTVCSRATLEIIMEPLEVKCNSCSEISENANPLFRCPSCGSTDVRLLNGKDLILERIEMESSDAETQDSP